jgi:hypothetical protein
MKRLHCSCQIEISLSLSLSLSLSISISAGVGYEIEIYANRKQYRAYTVHTEYGTIVIYYSKWGGGGVGSNKSVTGKWRFSTYCNKSTGPALGIGSSIPFPRYDHRPISVCVFVCSKI